jgi:hypothetical protein
MVQTIMDESPPQTAPLPDLVGLSRQVLYDFEMVEALAKRQVDLIIGASQSAWNERFPWPGSVKRDWFEVNAFIESQAMHARSLVDFLYDSPPSPERVVGRGKRGKATKAYDRFAEQWFDDPMTWRKARGKRPAALTDEALSQRVAREIAHLTEHRAGFKDGGPPWSPFDVYRSLATVVERFAHTVDRTRVCEDFAVRVEAAMPMRQPPPPTRYTPGAYSASVPTQGMPSGG